MTYIYRITYYNGEYIGILSEGLAQILEPYFNMSSVTSPLKLYLDNDNVMIDMNGEIDCIVQSYQNLMPSGLSFDTSQKQVIITTNELKLIQCNSTKERSINFIAGRDYSLKLSYIEQQSTLPWCAAYSAASIFRYLQNNITITAQNIMMSCYPNQSLYYLMQHSLSLDVLTNYAESIGYTPNNILGSVTYDTVCSEIASGKPLQLNMYISNTNSYHAIVLHGYKNYSSYYVWNPWYNYSEMMSAINNTYTSAGGDVMTWFGTIYGW